MFACTRCDEPVSREGALCEECRLDLYPPISARGGKYSPLALGAISLVCDPLLIPSILAMRRGVSELREVARREREGHWGDDHRDVRTGAVWGIVLGGARPALVVFFAIAVMFLDAWTPEYSQPWRPPYRPGVRITSDILADDVARRRGLEELSHDSTALSGAERRRLLRFAIEGDAPRSERSFVAERVLAGDLAHLLEPESLGGVGALDAPARSAAFAHLASQIASHDVGAPRGAAARRIALDLMRREQDPEAFPVRAYEAPGVAAWAFATLSALEPTRPLASRSLLVGAALCVPAGGPSPTFGSIRARALDALRGGEETEVALAARRLAPCLEGEAEVTEALASWTARAETREATDGP